MDRSSLLACKKSMPLLRRFPEVLRASRHDVRQSQWIVYGEHLSPSHFEDIEHYLGHSVSLSRVWKVGQYEVALMHGELPSQAEEILDALKLDCAPLTELPSLDSAGLVVFDMDSTVIQIECIDEIAALAGVGEEVSAVTELAMQGELDFEQSLRQRVAKLAGADEFILSQVKATLPLMPDLIATINALQDYGWKTAIASGGFTYFSDHLKELLELDEAKSNQLEIKEGKLTGQVLGDVVSAQTKADILHELAIKYDIEPHNTIAVGDGANDLVMMGQAGLGVAYKAKPKVRQQAQVAINQAGLGGLICLLSAGLIKQQRWK
jgi:phosphoserine phosphatase